MQIMTLAVRFVFIVMIFGFFYSVSYKTIISPTMQTTEGRQLASFPSRPSTYKDMQSYLNGIDLWATDRMHYRQQFIVLLNTAKFKLGYKVISGTLVGKEGWLFYNSEASKEHEDARGATQFTEEELSHWKNYLLYRDSNAKKMGAKFIFLMIPNKSTVYEEYLPYNFTRLSNNTRIQQIVDVMKDTGVSILDARAILEQGKKQGQIYLKTGSHWNMLGGNYAQYLVMQELSKDFPEFQPTLFKFHSGDIIERVQLDLQVDLYGQMGLPLGEEEPQVPIIEGLGKCVGENHPKNLRVWPLAVGDCSHLTDIQTDPEWNKLVMEKWGYLNEPLRKYLFQSTFYEDGHYSLLMMKDSFNEMTQPFFSNQFKKARYVGLGRPVDMTSWSWLEALQPDVIIEEMVERGLKDTVPRPGLDYPNQ